ncbi:MAG TPA: transaldolase [Ilumatobacteraceae bacterium]|nr:transaldolase [Ilumatobacteraceae bacterium]
MNALHSLNIKIFADGADLASMVALAAQSHIRGLTTNPTLMRQAGISDYKAFAADVLAAIPDKPISFEVFADEPVEMLRQARQIASWGENVYVKIPVTTTDGASTNPMVTELSSNGVKLNVTALMTPDQVSSVAAAMEPGVPAIISVFAGRVADTGRDPVPLMTECVDQLLHRNEIELIWASPRELLNIFQADAIGCDIITVTPDLLKKLELVGKDLAVFSLETVQMFYRDATLAGFQL